MTKLRFISDFLAYSDTKQTNNPVDQTKIKQVSEESSFTSLVRNKISITDGTVDQSISLSGASSEYLIIYTDQEITIKLDGSSDSRTLKPLAAGTKTLTFFERGGTTTLTVSNSSGNLANLDIISAKL